MKSQTINVNYLNFSFHENQRPYDTRPKILTKVYNRITNPEFQLVVRQIGSTKFTMIIEVERMASARWLIQKIKKGPRWLLSY